MRADPVPFLELIGPLQSKASRLADVELEVKQLRDTLAEYNEEFRQVRNQGKTSLKKKQQLHSSLLCLFILTLMC